MSAKTECDNCRVLGDSPVPPGWVHTVVQPEPCESSGLSSGLVAALTGGHSCDAEEPKTFCGWQCVAEYATAGALVPAEDPEGGGT